MYNKDKIFKMTGLSESEFYKKYPTKAHFEKEHGADIFAKGGFIQDDATKSNQKAFNKSEQMYNDSLALFNSANLDSQWMAKVDKNKVSRKDFNAQMQTQDRDALQDAYDRLLRTNNQAPEISSDTLNVLRSNSPKATKELILMNKYKKPTNPPLNPNNFPTKKERDAMDLKQMNLYQQFANGGLMKDNPELQQVMQGLRTTAGGAIGGAGAGLGIGATLGGVLGTVVPGVGNAVGAAAGATLGTLGGGLLGGLGGASKSFFADGGQLTEINAGGTHEANSNGGVPVMEGKLAEEGETIFDSDKGKYVFSDRITKGKKSFADLSKEIEKKYSKRTGDKLAETARKRELSALMLQQEAEKALASNNSQNEEMFATGGFINKTDFLSSFIGQPSGTLTNALVTLDANKLGRSGIQPLNTRPTPLIPNSPSTELGIKEGNNFANPDLSQSVDGGYNPNKFSLTSPTGLRTLKTPGSLNPSGKYDTPKKVAGAFDIKAPNYDTEAGKSIAKIKGKYGYNPNKNNFNLKDIDLSMLEYLPQTAGSLFNIAKGIGSNKQINYKSITPKLNSSNYNLTSSLTNLNSDSAGVNADIRNNSNLSLAQKISALGSVSANTQKARASMINEGNYNNMMGNTNLINTAKQYNAGVFDRNIDANEMYQDKRAEAIKSGLDNLGTGSSTYIKDKRATKYEGLNNELLGTLMRELYPEATKRAKYKFNR